MKTIAELAREAGIRDCTCDGTLGCLERLIELVRADEREACAKVCDEEQESFMRDAFGSDDGRYDWKADGAMNCADAIRARGDK